MMVLRINTTPLDYERADHILEGLASLESDPFESPKELAAARRQLLVGCLALCRQSDRNPFLRFWRRLSVNL